MILLPTLPVGPPTPLTPYRLFDTMCEREEIVPLGPPGAHHRIMPPTTHIVRFASPTAHNAKRTMCVVPITGSCRPPPTTHIARFAWCPSQDHTAHRPPRRKAHSSEIEVRNAYEHAHPGHAHLRRYSLRSIRQRLYDEHGAHDPAGKS